MVRTGMRPTEQGSLTALEIPKGGGGQAYHRFWVSVAIAKGGSARWVYVLDGIARRIGEYIATDRADVIEQARARGAGAGRGYRSRRSGHTASMDPRRDAAARCPCHAPDGAVWARPRRAPGNGADPGHPAGCGRPRPSLPGAVALAAYPGLKRVHPD